MIIKTKVDPYFVNALQPILKNGFLPFYQGQRSTQVIEHDSLNLKAHIKKNNPEELHDKVIETYIERYEF